MNIIFWLEYPLFHVAPLIKSLSFHEGINITVVTEFEIPQWRLDMGFYKPDFGLAKEYFCPGPQERKILINDFSSNNDYHVFHGLRHVKENFKCFKALVNKDTYVGLYFEPQQFAGSLKAKLRKMYYRLLMLRYGKKINFMLALGDLGANQYIELGLPAHKVFPFEYYFDQPTAESFYKNPSEKLSFLYAGQLVKRKNIGLVIDAINLVVKQGRSDFEFLIIGDGEQKNELKKLVLDYELDSFIKFSNSVPSEELKEYYLSADAFILASRFEGWGAVATEAISFGLPLIISDGCASSCIIKDEYHGFAFENDSVESLKNKLSLFINKAEHLTNDLNREKRIKYAKECFSGESGSKKLLKILNEIN